MCTPSRGTIVTGLYSHQTFLLVTQDWAGKPPLSPAFPTYGKLLRELGYVTPYVGKWHLSQSPAFPNESSSYLQEYGFEGLTIPDPWGFEGEGIGEAPGKPSDADIAAQAIQWLSSRDHTSTQPFCLTASFINPHDIAYFWGGTEWETFKAVYDSINETVPVTWRATPEEQDPPSFGYPSVPPNFETDEQLLRNKPLLQSSHSEFTQYQMGGISYDSSENTTFTAAPSSCTPGRHKAMAPHYYWRRALDLYTQLLGDVDAQIGRLMQYVNSSADLADNTIIVFTSDHGEYAGAHGLRNKGHSAYEETIHVPLIVVDPTGQFTGDIADIREQLTSHVDLVRLLVSLGNNGSSSWMNSTLEQIYGTRLDLIPILQSSKSPGRDYIAYATDDTFLCNSGPNFTFAPSHVTALRTATAKVALYSDWFAYTDEIVPDNNQMEFYDLAAEDGLLELSNLANTTAAKQYYEYLLQVAMPEELRRPLPAAYQYAQEEALLAYWNFILQTQ